MISALAMVLSLSAASPGQGASCGPTPITWVNHNIHEVGDRTLGYVTLTSPTKTIRYRIDYVPASYDGYEGVKGQDVLEMLGTGIQYLEHGVAVIPTDNWWILGKARNVCTAFGYCG